MKNLEYQLAFVIFCIVSINLIVLVLTANIVFTPAFQMMFLWDLSIFALAVTNEYKS